MLEKDYQITIPFRDYKILKDKEEKLKQLEKEILSCFDKNYILMGKPIPIYKNKLITIGKRYLPSYCKYANFVEV